MRPSNIGVSLLLILGAAQAAAQPGGYLHDGRETVRAFFTQNATVDRGDSRAEAQLRVQPERRQARETGLTDSSGYSASGEVNSASNSASDNGRRQPGRLTPEERRALRRQIDEANHDIYAPKR